MRAIVAALLLASGCAVSVPVGDAVDVAVGETVVTVAGPVTFVAVAEDSRCPQDVQCVWAGRVAIDVSVGDQTVRLEGISTPDGPAYGERPTAQIDGYLITVLDVTRDEPYRATLVVDRVGGS